MRYLLLLPFLLTFVLAQTEGPYSFIFKTNSKCIIHLNDMPLVLLERDSILRVNVNVSGEHLITARSLFLGEHWERVVEIGVGNYDQKVIKIQFSEGDAVGAEIISGDSSKTADIVLIMPKSPERKAVSLPLPSHSSIENVKLRFEFTIDPTGEVKTVKLVGLTNKMMLKRQGILAIQKWRFDPLPKDVPQQDQTAMADIVFRAPKK